MTTAYTSLLGLALPVTGELSGTWGDVVNNSITSLVDTSVAGTTNISTDANVTLTTTTGASNQARQAILLFSGARTAIRTVTAPAQSKIYTVINATTGGFAVTLVGAGPTTGVTIANGARTVVAWNGSDFVEVSSPSSIILPGGTANGVLYLNGSKVVTSGSALTFDGTNFATTGQIKSTLNGLSFLASGSTGQNLLYSANNGTQEIRFGISASNSPYVGTISNDPLQFLTNGSEKARLSSDGNLGLGVTPSAWSSISSKALQIDKLTLSQVDGFDTSSFATNAFYNGSWRYIGSASAAKYDQQAGSHRWLTAASGTAGNAITFTQAMTLSASGYLGIAQTSPAYYLDILSSGLSGTEKIVLSVTDGINSTIQLKQTTSYNQVYANNVLSFGVSGAERARIDSSGNLLVGTTSTIGKFTVSSSTSVVGISANNTSGAFAVDNIQSRTSAPTTNGTFNYFAAYSDYWAAYRFRVLDSGNVQNTNNSYGAISDVKLKENIVDATPKLAGLMQVKVRNYNMIGDTTKQIGVVAQELETVFPAMVDETPDYEEVTTTDEDGNETTERVAKGTTTKSVKYSVFVPMLIKAIQEQQAIIESLKARLDAANL
jgi:hypothetical protein